MSDTQDQEQAREKDGNTAYGQQAVQAVQEPLRRPHHRRRPGRLAGRGRAATAWSSAGPAPGRAARWSPAGCSAWRTPSPSPSPTPSRTTAAGASPSTRTAGPGARHPLPERGLRRSGRRDYPGGVSVPAIVDVPTAGRWSPTTTSRSPWTWPPSGPPCTAPGAPDLYPERAARRDRRGDGRHLPGRQQRCLPGGVRHRPGGVRGGVRRCVPPSGPGLRPRLAGQRYLVGDTITEADIRLFTTLVRFDAVYHGHFKCNRWKLAEDPVLWAYVRDLYQTPGLRRHRRLRPHQAALLPGAHRHQPDRHRAARPGPVGLARPRTTGRSWAAGRSATAPRPGPCRPARRSRRSGRP